MKTHLQNKRQILTYLKIHFRKHIWLQNVLEYFDFCSVW